MSKKQKHWVLPALNSWITTLLELYRALRTTTDCSYTLFMAGGRTQKKHQVPRRNIAGGFCEGSVGQGHQTKAEWEGLGFRVRV